MSKKKGANGGEFRDPNRRKGEARATIRSPGCGSSVRDGAQRETLKKACTRRTWPTRAGSIGQMAKPGGKEPEGEKRKITAGGLGGAAKKRRPTGSPTRSRETALFSLFVFFIFAVLFFASLFYFSFDVHPRGWFIDGLAKKRISFLRNEESAFRIQTAIPRYSMAVRRLNNPDFVL